MKIIYTDNYEQLSKKAAEFIARQVNEKPDSVLGLATGGTPVGTYKELTAMCRAGLVDFSAVKTFNLDEYCALPAENENSYRYFMNDNLFNHINIDIKNTRVPNGMAEDIAAECKEYEKGISDAGGIDLQLLGIGHNGHIAFNEPSDFFSAETHTEKLSDKTIEANTRFFSSPDEVPRTAITMGIGSIMRAARILLIASGADKKEILEKAISGPITPRVPASVLQLHRDVTVIACVK